MRQSLYILYQCINRLPNGPIQHSRSKLFSDSNWTFQNDVNSVAATVNNKDPRVVFGENMEALIHHFKAYTLGYEKIQGQVFVSTEAPKGEFGVSLISANSHRPYRCKIKAPGFFHLQGINLLAKNHFIADIVTIIGTLDIVFGEVDR